MSLFGDLLDGVSGATKAKLNAAGRRRHFDSGSDLMTSGQTSPCVFLIHSGRVKVWRPSRSGGGVILYYLGSGDTPGLVAACRGGEMPVSMTAVSPVEADCWAGSLVCDLLAQDIRLAGNGLAIVSRAVEMLSLRLEDVTSTTVAERLSRALLRLAGELSQWNDDSDIRIDITRQELADMTGATLYTVSRTASAWARLGILKSDRGRITIRNPNALAHIAKIN